MLPERVNVLVVGGGTAGAATAGRAAEIGLRVLCVDRRPMDEAGARWVNGVGRQDFLDAGIAPPTGAELRGEDTRFHMFARRGPHAVVIEQHGVLDVDMRLLVTRLQERARGAGAMLRGEVRVEAVAGGVVRTSAGSVHADLVVDASGLSGARLLGAEPRAPGDICAAAQAVHEVADRSGAKAFLESHGARDGETICFTGVSGGYSILNVRVHGDEVGLLTGSIPADGHTPGKLLLDRFVDETAWIGARRFGGHRPIPLGPPRSPLVAERIAAVGDAAGQVFAAHGSGIGAGMIAGRMLAETFHETGSATAYDWRWMRRFGGLFAAYDAFRRFTQRLSGAQIETLMASGVLDAESAAAGLSQRWPRPNPRRAARLPGQLRQAGRLGSRLVAIGGRMAALQALYAVYPKNRLAQARWRRLAAAASGSGR